MGRILDKLDRIDRRFLYLLMALSVFLPLALRLNFPIPVSPGPSKDLFDAIEALPAGTPVLVSYDYDPSTMPELQPMAVAITQHLMSRGIPIVAVALWPQGASLAQNVMTEVSDTLGLTEYEDWVNLGYTVGGIVSLVRMGSSISAVFPQDRVGVPYGSIPVLEGIDRLSDLGMVISLSAGDPGIHAWVMVAQGRYGIPVGGGCTAVSAPEFYTYLGTGQLVGLLGGLKGAADYETLLMESMIDSTPGATADQRPVPSGTPCPEPARSLFDAVEALEPGSAVLISVEYDPAVSHGLARTTGVLARHLLFRDLRVVAVSAGPRGTWLADRILFGLSDSMGLSEYDDWVNLGPFYGAPDARTFPELRLDSVFETDITGIPTRYIPALDGMERFGDFDLVISVSSRSSDPLEGLASLLEGVIPRDLTGFAVGIAGRRALSGGSVRIAGLIDGFVGTAAYGTLLENAVAGASSPREARVRFPAGNAIPGMAAQSISHLVIMGFIVIGNIAFIAGRKSRKGGAR